MKRFMYVAGLVALTGCGISEDKFAEESTRLSCELLAECFPELVPDVDACIEDAEPADTEGCEFDKGAAKDCLDALEEATCDTDPADLGDACDSVYTCEDTEAAE